MELDREEAEHLIRTLSLLNKMPHDELCPACGKGRIDPKSKAGWCVACTSKRERQLESKRHWWEKNRGAGAKKK